MTKEMINFTKVIGEPTRLRIINHLKKDCCVGDLWEKLNLPQNLVSHHLRVLREAHLISAKKQGKRVVYKSNVEVIKRDLEKLTNYLI